MIIITPLESHAAALEEAIDRLETVVAAREQDSVRLIRLEAAANDAIAALDTLLEGDS